MLLSEVIQPMNKAFSFHDYETCCIYLGMANEFLSKFADAGLSDLPPIPKIVKTNMDLNQRTAAPDLLRDAQRRYCIKYMKAIWGAFGRYQDLAIKAAIAQHKAEN